MNMKYLAIFIWHGDDTASWSTEVDTLDKDKVTAALLKVGNHKGLDWAEILVLRSEARSNRLVGIEYFAPQVVKHWSALNGDFG